MKQHKPLTFFTPTLLQTGSEIVLVNLLMSLPSNFSYTLFSYYAGGNLWDKLRKDVPKNFLYSNKVSSGLYQKIRHRFEKHLLLPLKLKRYRKSVWYINTIVLPEILYYAEKWKVTVVVHSHELEQMYRLLSAAQLKRLLTYPELIIANSQTSADVLIKLGRTKPINICYPAIDTSKLSPDEPSYFLKRAELGFGIKTKLWVMCGTLDENKNPFLFLEIANIAVKQNTHLKFMWIGGTSNSEFIDLLKNKTIELGLENTVFWAGEVNEKYYSYFNCADGLLLTSRKESFSLVTLEALLLGIPVVANDCGGVSELLRSDAGFIENSAKKLAKAVLDCSQDNYQPNTTLLRQRAEEFDIKKWSTLWLNMITNFINKGE